MADNTTTEGPSEPPKDLIGFLDFYLVKKAPFQLPDVAREWIVTWGPWITIVLLVLLLPPLLLVLGVGTVFIPFGGYSYATGFTLATIFLFVQFGLTIAALPGLFARKMGGWTLLFYAQLVGLVFSILSGSIVGGILSALIGLYILFQVRGLYKTAERAL